MTKKIDDIWNFIDETTSYGCTSSPTSEEIICEIKKWADSIPELLQNNQDERSSFLGAEMYQPSKESILLGLGIDKDFDSDKISLRVMNDRFPVCVRTPSFITLGFHA